MHYFIFCNRIIASEICTVFRDEQQSCGPSLDKRKLNEIMKKIFKVVAQTEPIMVQSQKVEGGILRKSTLVLQEPGGKYENVFACTLLGTLATTKYYPGEIVHASLSFNASEYNGVWYQDVLATDIIKLNK